MNAPLASLIPWLASAWAAVFFANAGRAEPPAVLSTARQVAESYTLPEPMPPVDLEVDVLGSLPHGAVLLRDETGVTFVKFPYQGPAVEAGNRVRVRGQVFGGAFINGIAHAVVEKTGVGRRPEPRRIRPANLGEGDAYHDLVTLTGVGRSVRRDEKLGTVVIVNGDGGTFEARCEFPLADADAARLLDAEVRFTGFGGGEATAARYLIRPFLRVVGPEGLEVRTPAPADPFAVQSVPLHRVNQALRTGHRVKVTGVATAPGGTGGGIFIAAGDRGLFIKPLEPDAAIPIAIGAAVEAVGFGSGDAAGFAVVDALVRVVGKAVPPGHRRLPDVSMQDKRHEEWFDDFRQVSCNALPIEAEIDVTSRIDAGGTTEITGVMPVTKKRFHVHVQGRLPAAVASESRVLIRGVCRVTSTRPDPFFAVPVAFDLWSASPADIIIVRAARWWTKTRLAWTLGGSAALMAAMLVWVTLLRRQVWRQARELAATMQTQHDATIEFETALRERNRLAANLHDTVLQTVTGLGYQLQAVQAIGSRDGAVDVGRLAVAGRMADHAIQQLRGTVWALHTLPAGGERLVARLEALLARLHEGRDSRITFAVEGDEVEVSEFVAGNLLLLVQEAVTNALRHASASAVAVTVKFGVDGVLSVTVHDDGLGFRVGSQPGSSRGHFGIEAMMDRMQAVGGRFGIESREGAGTTVVAEVRARSEEHLSDGPVSGAPVHG